MRFVATFIQEEVCGSLKPRVDIGISSFKVKYEVNLTNFFFFQCSCFS